MKFKQCMVKTKFLLLAFMLILASIFGVAKINSVEQVYASSFSSFEQIDNAFINSKFDSNTSSSYPFKPNGYDVSFNSKDEENKDVNGVINLKDKEYQSKYANSNRDEEKQYVLMIKSSAEYTTANSYSLAANSHYEITVMVYTDVDDGIASLFLYDSDATSNTLPTICAINDISSYNKWTEMKFYVSTSQFASLNVKLGLAANGNGVALFDNLTVRKLSESALNSFKNSNYVDRRTDDEKYLVQSSVLSPNNKLFTKYGTNDVDYSYYRTAEEDKELTDGLNNTAFVVNHDKKTFSIFKTTEDYFKFSKNNIYRVSIIAKAVNLDGQATLKLNQTGKDQDPKTQTVNISSATNSSMNGYSAHNIFVKAPSLNDVQFELELDFGSEDSGASGQVYISSINVYKVDYATYNAGTKISFDETDTTGIANGEFNSLEITDALKPYPATASSWAVSAGDSSSKQVYGIVNTDKPDFDKMVSDNGLTNLAANNPYDGRSNNVLMMYNANSNTLTYTSPAKTITASNNLSAVKFKIYPVLANVKVSLVHNNNGEYITLCSKNIQESSQWNDEAIYFTSPYQNLDLSLQITLDSQGWGACFVDDVSFVESVSQDLFANNNGFDLSNLMATDNLNEFDFSKSNFFVGSGDLKTVGIVDITNSNLSDIVAIYDPEELELLRSYRGSNKNVLVINAQEKASYSFNSKVGFSLIANSYYKLSIDVFTRNIEDNDENKNGAFISLSSFEESFKEIKTTGWETYTFYIKPDSDASFTTISLGLGGAENECVGTVFFGNINFTPLTEVQNDDDFNALSKSTPASRTLVLNKVKADTNENETESDSNNESNNSINLWYFIPSLLFAVVIIICVVAVILKKVKWKKPGKKVKNSYDRNKTVSVQYYTRKASIEREKRVRELQKEVDNLTNDRTKYEEEYKHDLSKMRELKIKRASASEISALDKDMKKNRKLASAIGVNIAKLENELSYVKSDAYLNAVIKKLSTEKKPVEATDKSEDETLDEKTPNKDNANKNEKA